MVFACGLSNYSVSLFHLVNHGFFVWQHRYFNLKDGFSFRSLIQGFKLTYLLSKLKVTWNKKGEREWTLVKTSLSWLKLSTLYEKIPQEKGIKKPHIKSWWSIESTLLLLTLLFLLIGNNRVTIKVLKVGKPVKIWLNFLLIWLFLEISWKKLIQYGCRIVTKLIALSNVKDRFFWITSWEGWIDYSCLTKLSIPCNWGNMNNINPGINLLVKSKNWPPSPAPIGGTYGAVRGVNLYRGHIPYKPQILIIRSIHKSTSKNSLSTYHLILFKKELKFIFKSYRKFETLFQDLQTILWRYLILIGKSQQVMRKLDNIIHQNCWLWIKKKHVKVNKKDLYNQYFETREKFLNFNLIKSRYILSGVISRGKHTINKDSNFFSQDFFSMWESLNIIDHFLWPNVEQNIEKICEELKGKSGIYIFWLTNNKSNCYVGSGVDLSRRIKTHYRNALINHKHPKFYNAVKKYGWSCFSLQILDIVPRFHLLIREQYWLTLLKQSTFWENSYNLLEKANSWEGYKHTLESKLKISTSKKGKSLTPEHIKNISLGKIGPKHHLYGKKRDPEVIDKIKNKLINHPSLTQPWSQEKKDLLSLKQSKPLILYDLDGNIVEKFSSTTLAMKNLKIGHVKLKRLLNGELLNNLYSLR